jgi:hypothetical protein
MRLFSGPFWAGSTLCGLLFLSSNAVAQDATSDPAPDPTPPTDTPSAPGDGETGSGPSSTYLTEYIKRLKRYQTIEPLGENPFGESIDLYTGQVTFTHTDIVLEGTGPTIRVSRSRSPTGFDASAMDNPPAQYFGDWTLNLPRIDTLVAAQRYVYGTPAGNWRMTYSMTDPASYLRCTNFAEPYIGQSGIDLEQWWHGYQVILDDGSQQSLLVRDAAYATKPGMTGAFPVVTLSNLQMTCLPEAKNVEAGQLPGEAFLAIAPDGTKYWFDWLVGNLAGPVNQAVNGAQLRQERMQVSMFVTRVEDRFGNWLNYTYSGMQLQSIVASDQRRVDFAWSGNQVTSITVMPGTVDARTWQYAYNGLKLSTVTLPDQSKWTFNLARTGEGDEPNLSASSCTYRYEPNTPYAGGEVSTITAPSGLVGTFLMQLRSHGRSYSGSYCVEYGEYYELVPPMFRNLSLYERTVSGPGVPTATWRYLYSPAQASTLSDACAANSSCPDSAWVDVVEPDGAKTRYIHSTRYNALEGKLLKTETFSPTNELLRTEATTYVLPSEAPYVALIGRSMFGYMVNEAKSENLTPVRERVITQQGRTFSWKVDSTCGTGTALCFDAFARPTKVTKSSSPTP